MNITVKQAIEKPTTKQFSNAAAQQLLVPEQAERAAAEYAVCAKDEFVAVVMHELRNPTNAILGWARILRLANGNATQIQYAIDVIERNARSQSRLINDLLDLSRGAEGKLHLEMEWIDVASVIKTALDVIRPEAEAKMIELRATYDQQAGAVYADPHRLEQVIWNLLSNAVKFTPQGGCIEVSLECVEEGIRITVADNGEGISTEFLPYIFDRFHQAPAARKREYGGLGLGLCLVRSLVEAQGGSVRAESQGAGCGATFTIHLPLRRGEDGARGH